MTGRKLLLADDSVTIQRVIDLTFSDEGMEVTTVGDGEQAISKLEEFTPDIVLADVLMPGLDGYRLCEFIKHSEKFQGIPVMLLVGSFEPFDEAEARRVGADDFLTKPFQSIRQLVSRVGSLLGGKPADVGFSTLGLGQTSATPRVSAAERSVEAAPVITAEKQREIEAQTADTQKLQPVEAVGAVSAASLYNNSEAQPVNMLTAKEATVIAKDDVVLDLDDFGDLGATPDEDSILDLEYIDSGDFAAPAAADDVQPAIEEYELALEPVSEAADPEWRLAETQPVGEEVSGAEGRATVATAESPASQAAATGLSSEAVNAIAERVVEKLSDKVVREIAWEVVPELAELLIKQRMDEPKK